MQSNSTTLGRLVCDIPDTDSLVEVATGTDVLATGTLTYTIQILTFARATVTGLPIPGLTGAVGAALRVAELLNVSVLNSTCIHSELIPNQNMRDTDRSLVMLINNVGGLIQTICDQGPTQRYPEEVINAIHEFGRYVL
jgi:hypothetical protein